MSGDDPTAPALRASDADRERAATQLREHCADGRLTPEELSERLDGAYAARTVPELQALLADLPALEPERTPAAHAPTREHAKRRVLHAVGVAVLVNLAFVLLFFATGAYGSFWPKWIMLLSLIRLAFLSWNELGPGAADDEARLGRGGSERLYRVERGDLRSRRDSRGGDGRAQGPADRR
jgi:hypothetical protein